MKTTMKVIGIVVATIALVISMIIGAGYIAGFRYNSEDGLQLITATYEDIPDEDKHYYSENYTSRWTHIKPDQVIPLFIAKVKA